MYIPVSYTHLDVYKRQVLGIYKNSLQLRELITELLDFRKQEQGQHYEMQGMS